MLSFLNHKPIRWTLIALGIALVLALGFRVLLLNHHGLQDRVVRAALLRVFAERAEQSASYGGDNLDIVFCGTASPMGNTGRAQQCIAVLAGDRFFIIDSGARSTAVASNAALPLGRLDGVLLTHFHSDHIAALGELHLASWVAGRGQKLAVYGGPGVARVVNGFNIAYGQDYTYRTAHHGEAIMPPANAGLVAHPFALPKLGRELIFQDDTLTISAFVVPHEPVRPAVGFRIDYGGRSVVVSGDTSKSARVADAAKNTDLLIHEVLQPELVKMLAEVASESGQTALATLVTDTLDYHTSPIEAAELATQANVKMLVFTHFAPSPPNELVERIFLRDVPREAVLAEDGMHIRLPLGSEDIIIMNE